MKLAVLTSHSLRHHYYLASLAEAHELAAVVRERKRDLVQASAGDEPEVMRAHLHERDAAEERYFGAHTRPVGERVLDVDSGDSNTPRVHRFLQDAAPDVVLLFGTSIIEPPILTHFEGRIVNLHLGLSPYYRGTATNFWPLVNREPECAGATIHHAILRVDAGAVLHQVRPALAPDDGAHDVGCKALVAAVAGVRELLARAERGATDGTDGGGAAWRAGLPEGRAQPRGEGRLYRRRDFSAKAVERMRANLADAMIPDYLAAKAERDAAFPLVELRGASSAVGAGGRNA